MYNRDQSEEARCFLRQIENAIRGNDTTKFVTLVNHADANNISLRTYGGSIPVRAPELFRAICKYGSYTCARALVTGATSLNVDLNAPCEIGFCALHHAAYRHVPEIAQLLIDHGAHPNLRCRGRLPLDSALESLRYYYDCPKWTPNLSMLKLIIVPFLPEMRHAMKTISLIASKTMDTENHILNYAKLGYMFELAVLLMVTKGQTSLFRAEILSQIDLLDSVLRLLRKDYIKRITPVYDCRKEKLMYELQFVEVIEKLRGDLAGYMKINIINDSFKQNITDVVSYLKQAGFILTPEVSIFIHERWFEDSHKLPDELLPDELLQSTRNNVKFNDQPKGLVMPHYFSWGYHGKPMSETVRTSPPTIVDAEFRKMVKGVEHYSPRSRPLEVAASFIKRLLRRK